MARSINQKNILAELEEEVVDITTLPDYDEAAIHALNRFQPKHSVADWKLEVALIVSDDQCSFKEAVYEALVSNYLNTSEN